MDLTLWIEVSRHSVQRRKKPETQVVKKEEGKKGGKNNPQWNRTQNEYKKKKFNIMYKINVSSYLSSFILARKTRRKENPTIVKHRAQI